MLEITEIIDPDNFKRRNVRNLRVTNHLIPDQETGKETLIKCVEYIVVGLNNEWNDYSIYDEFKKVNPEITVIV